MTFARPAPITREQRIAARQAPRARSTLEPLHVGHYGGEVQAVAPKPIPKLTRREKVRQDIRDSARGEECTVRYTGVCCNDAEKTILSHARWPDAGRGGATKAICVAGAYACVPCDQAYDGQTPTPPGYTRDRLDLEWAMGHFRTLVRLVEKGLL